MNIDGLWSAVSARDAKADGLFVYAVTSTGVFCRPSCGSRRPRPENVRFFPSPTMAAAEGYRPCLRCRPAASRAADPRVERVSRACVAIASRPSARWTPASVARQAGSSVRQIQRAFRETLGLSPRDYAAACRRRRFYASLRTGRAVTDAIYESGYGSTSRVYGAIQLPGMTPATYGRGGAGAEISWLVSPSPIGDILVAGTTKGLCFVEVGSGADALRASLVREFPKATIAPRPSSALRPLAAAALAIATARPVPDGIAVDIAGTAFQWRVWRALTSIARGETRSYADIARVIGRPSSVRAVARACATNPLTLVVPCHRVVPRSGGAGGYRWGKEIKERLLDLEREGGRRRRDQR